MNYKSNYNKKLGDEKRRKVQNFITDIILEYQV